MPQLLSFGGGRPGVSARRTLYLETQIRKTTHHQLTWLSCATILALWMTKPMVLDYLGTIGGKSVCQNLSVGVVTILHFSFMIRFPLVNTSRFLYDP